MADVQHALLSKIILHQELVEAVNARITAEYFTDDRYNRVWLFLVKHWREYGSSPDLSVVERAFPHYQWVDSEQPTQYFIDQLRERRQKAILTEGLTDAAGFLADDENPDATAQILTTMRDTVAKAYFETAPTYDFDLTQRGDAIARRLDDRQDDPGALRGISTGFNGIDYVTGGLQPEQFVVLLGTPKSFKSATLLAMAIAVHQQARTPLFLGFEMSNIEQEDRILSLLAGVSLTKIMNGTFSVKDRRKIDLATKQLEGMRAFTLSADIAAATTVSGIQAKIQALQPDVMFIDGAYLMQSELPNAEPGSAQAVTSISRGLKRLAQRQKIPVVVTTQASATRAKQGVLHMNSAMYSQSWGQDADILLGVERQGVDQTDELDAVSPVQVKFRVIGSRSGPRRSTLLEWDWNQGLVREYDPARHARLTFANDDGTSGGWQD